MTETRFSRRSFIAAAVMAAGARFVGAEKHKTDLPIIIDGDTGRDDAWEILGAIRNHNLAGVVASYGNVALPFTIRNSLDVVALGQRGARHHGRHDIPVWAGESEPLQPASPAGMAEIERRWKIFGNGICNLTLPASPAAAVNQDSDWLKNFSDFIRDKGTVNYLASGPLTNVTRLTEVFGKDARGRDRIHDHVARLIAMGGSFAPDLAVDFNFKADPAAAQRTIETFGKRITLLPFDETKKLKLTEDQILKLQPGTEAAAFSRDLMLAQARGWSDDGTIMLHDPATLLVLDGLTDIREETVRIQLDGANAGKIIDDPNGTTVLRAVIPQGGEQKATQTILNRYLDLRF